MEKTGIIFDISHYMLEDGPGIRTNVFLKGCFLRCKWCSNAYGLEQRIQLSYDPSKCVGCKACVSVCEAEAVSQKDVSSDSYPSDSHMTESRQNDINTDNSRRNYINSDSSRKVIQDFSKCTDCMKCVSVCPTKARRQIGRRMTVRDVVKEAEKDRMFYRRGDGGVTLSGGEILMQPEFAAEILRQCRNEGLNTAIETSGFGKWEDLEAILNCCDNAFIDCKCMEPEKHRKLTGVDNSAILDNITKAADHCKKKGVRLVVRLPLIPTYNDDEENLLKTAEFVGGLAGRPLLNILPYHNFGAPKYGFLGKRYETENLKPQEKDDLDRVREILSRTDTDYSIGGYDI